MKEQHLFKNQIFCYIMHLFTTTFDQFNASLLIEHFYLFQGEKLVPGYFDLNCNCFCFVCFKQKWHLQHHTCKEVHVKKCAARY